MSSLGDIVVVLVASRSWVHVTVGLAQVFAHICANPVSRVAVVHGDDIGLVLARAWHVQVLCAVVNLDSEGELGLLLAWGVHFIWVARVRVVEVTWNVVDWTWHAGIGLLVSLLLLDISDLSGELSAIVNSRTLTTLGSHAEWSTLCNMGHMDRVVSAWAQVRGRLIFVTFLVMRLAKAPRWGLFGVPRVVCAWCREPVVLIHLLIGTSEEGLGIATALHWCWIVSSRTRGVLGEISLLCDVSDRA